MKVVIPRYVPIGKRRYRVIRDRRMVDNAGIIDFRRGTLRLSTHPLNRKELHEAFWHETTHGILHDQRSPLRDNESFVRAFAKRLTNVINALRFR